MTDTWQSVADDFDFVVATATQPQQTPQQAQPQQTPIQQHFNQNSVTGVVPWPEGQVTPEWVANANPQPVQQPVQQPAQQSVTPVQQPVQWTVPVADSVPNQEWAVVTKEKNEDNVTDKEKSQEPKPEFKLDEEIDNLLNEFGIEPLSKKQEPDNQPKKDDNQEWSDPEENDNKSIAKSEKINILLEKLATERDSLKDDLWQERYEKEQYKLAAEKLQNKLSEVIEQKTALEYDENKLQVNDDIKDFVHFYNKRSSDKSTQTPDSVLTKRTLAEAIKVVEAITNLNLDGYINQYYLASNPQIPKIWNNHYVPDQLGFDPTKPRERTVQEKKADPNWNPMEDRF